MTEPKKKAATEPKKKAAPPPIGTVAAGYAVPEEFGGQSASGAVDVQTADGRVVQVARGYVPVGAQIAQARANNDAEAPARAAAAIPYRAAPAPAQPVAKTKAQSAPAPEQINPVLAAAQDTVGAYALANQYAPVRMVGPGGHVVTTRTQAEQRAYRYSDEDAAAVKANEDSIKAARADIAAAEQRKQDAMAREAGASAEIYNREAASMERQEAELAEFKQHTMRERKMLLAAAERDDKEAEGLRGRYVASDVMRRIFGGIGMYFAGVGAGMQGQNPLGAMQFIQANLDAAWERDMQDLKHARGQGDRKRNIAADLIAQYGNEQAAHAAYISRAKDILSVRTEKVARDSANEQYQASALALAAAAKEQAAQHEIDAINARTPLQMVQESSTKRTGGSYDANARLRQDLIKNTIATAKEYRAQGFELDKQEAKRIADREDAKLGLGDGGKEFNAQVRELSKRKEEISEFKQSVSELASLAGTSGDLPGVGKIAGRLPDAAVGDDGRKFRQRMADVRQRYKLAITGAGASEKEMEEIFRASGLEEANSEDKIREGIGFLSRAVEAKERVMEAGYDPAAVEVFKRRVRAADPAAQESDFMAATGAKKK